LKVAAVSLLAGICSASGYRKVNLVADESGVAPFVDTRLVNAWGLAFDSNGLVYVADNHSGLVTLYAPNGVPVPIAVHLPAGAASTDPAAPTGMLFNPTNSFVMTSGSSSSPATFLIAGEDGTISGWNPRVDPTHATMVIDNSASNAVYKALARGHSGAGDVLFATDFHNRKVDVFDASFVAVHAPGAFVDPNLPSDYAPFGVLALPGEVIVAYAKQLPPDNDDDDAGPGHGYVDVFHPNGAFVTRLISQGALNSPWGLALAPANFGVLGGALLVGNFGDGRINAYDPNNGTFLGTINDINGVPIVIDGLWSLSFQPDAGSQGVSLYFTAGPEDESHGLLGLIRPTQS
jgi:uncharacterized protein (TIGR03118 family)